MDYNAVIEYSSRNGLIENFGILEDEIHLAVISGDSCSGSVSCEADYKLTVIDRNQLKEFGEYSADGICDTRTQTWLVDYNGEMVSFEMLAAFCTDIPEDCKPNDNSSLIFAYSNTLGLDSDVAAKWFESVLKTESTHPSVTEFGSIRFDSPIEEDVQVHSSLAEAINSIAANLRSPLSGTPKNNVLDAIKTILRTRKLRTCGASLVVYVSNKALVFYPKIPAAQLRAKHIALFSREPDLGGGTSDLATLATKTYGYGVVSNLTEESDKFAVPLFGKPLCIYYQNVFVQGGKGSIELEPFVFDQQNGYATVTTRSYEASIRLDSDQGGSSWSSDDNRNKVANVFNGYPLFHEGTYTVKIDYDFPPGRQYQLSNIVKTGDDCSISISCNAGYELVIKDTDRQKEFGEYSADAICDTSTQTWLVSEDEGFTPFKQLDAVCREIIPDDCIPSDNSSLIFAYSNSLGLDSDIAAKWFASMSSMPLFPTVTWFGSIRFDSPIEEDVQVHNDFNDTIDVISANLRSPLSGTPQNGVLDAIKKILSTRKLRLCGAAIVIYTHNGVDNINPIELIPQLRAKHISLYSREPGSVTSSNLAILASKTYGYSIFADLTEEADTFAMPYYGKEPLFYYQNVEVSGKGTVELLAIKIDYYERFQVMAVSHIPYKEPYEISIYFKSKPDSSTWSSKNEEKAGNTFSGRPRFTWEWNNVTVDYDFPDDATRLLSVRIAYNLDRLARKWAPYND